MESKFTLKNSFIRQIPILRSHTGDGKLSPRKWNRGQDFSGLEMMAVS